MYVFITVLAYKDNAGMVTLPLLNSSFLQSLYLKEKEFCILELMCPLFDAHVMAY